MADLAVSTDLIRPVQGLAASAAGAAKDKVKETAEAFEASFLSQMLKPMFEGLSTDGLFGGGQAEATWRSFLLDEMAKKTVSAGGIGLAGPVMNEMLKMQEGRR
ncbi:MAG: rod-binding protein [Caulobacterales bacterium RIFOXYB1_FULL_67_16]|jgi:flagellar protein FlgJ|nr:MAG: rod-binding protein [Caulobacterales bacterium RIFOXYB1_FULL_67_16]